MPTVYEAEETFSWGGSETTYFDGNEQFLATQAVRVQAIVTDASGNTAIRKSAVI